MESSLAEKAAENESLSNETQEDRAAKEAALTELESLKEKASELTIELETLREHGQSLGEESQKIVELSNQLQKVKDENAELLRSQKDDQHAITRLNDEIATLRATAAATPGAEPAQEPPSASSPQSTMSQPAIPNSAHKFFDSSASGATGAEQLFGAPAPAPGAIAGPSNAQELFGAPPPDATNAGASGAQELFGAPAPAAASGSGQDFFGATPAQGTGAQEFFTGGSTPENNPQQQGGATIAEETPQLQLLESQLNEARQELQKMEESAKSTESALRGKP